MQFSWFWLWSVIVVRVHTAGSSAEGLNVNGCSVLLCNLRVAEKHVAPKPFNTLCNERPL